MKKRIVTIALVVALLATCFAGTYAYLMDTDQVKNTMTVGNVTIEQLEYQRKEGIAHNATATEGDLVPFVQDQPMYPAIPTAAGAYTAEGTDLFKFGPYTSSGTAACGLFNDNKLSNQRDKFVFVKNTGKFDCYYRTIFAFELPEGMEYDEDSPTKELYLNVNSSKSLTWETLDCISIGGTRYLIMSATYNKVLEAGKTSIPTLLQVVLTDKTTNEDMALLGDTYDILTLSQAVQAAGFNDATTALDTAFGDVTPEAAAEWLKNVQ